MRSLALVALLAGCTDTATSIHLYVGMPEAAGIDGLAVVVESQRALAPATTELTVLVPDDWSGMPVRLEVEGMAATSVIALGSTDVMPVRGEQITAFVQLVDADCAVVCTPGDVRCEGDGVATCEMVGACPAWSAATACPTDAPFCSNGTCAATCTDECSADAASCDGANSVRGCANVDSDPCLDVTTTACDTDEHCEAGACVADSYVCPSSCSSATEPADAVGGFASDGAYIYWVDKDGVKRRSENSGVVETIATRNVAAPGPIAVDATHVYWKDTASRISRAPKTGGPAEAVFSGSSLTVNDIAIDDTYVYWTESTAKIRRRPKDGSGTISWVGSSNTGAPHKIVVDATYMYVSMHVDDSATDAYVSRFLKDASGPAINLLSNVRAWSIAVDDTHVYAMTNDVERLPKAGGTRETIFSGASGYQLAIDATHVAWVQNDKVTVRAKTGGATTELGASTQESALLIGTRSIVSSSNDATEIGFSPRCACVP